MDWVDTVRLIVLSQLRTRKPLIINEQIIITAVSFLYPNMTGVLVYGVPVYATLLLTMAWRATARVERNLPKVFGSLGAFLFVISDSFIAFDIFYTPIKYSKLIIISTYYLAQVGITLTVLDHEVMTKRVTKSN